MRTRYTLVIIAIAIVALATCSESGGGPDAGVASVEQAIGDDEEEAINMHFPAGGTTEQPVPSFTNRSMVSVSKINKKKGNVGFKLNAQILSTATGGLLNAGFELAAIYEREYKVSTWVMAEASPEPGVKPIEPVIKLENPADPDSGAYIDGKFADDSDRLTVLICYVGAQVTWTGKGEVELRLVLGGSGETQEQDERGASRIGGYFRITERTSLPALEAKCDQFARDVYAGVMEDLRLATRNTLNAWDYRSLCNPAESGANGEGNPTCEDWHDGLLGCLLNATTPVCAKKRGHWGCELRSNNGQNCPGADGNPMFAYPCRAGSICALREEHSWGYDDYECVPNMRCSQYAQQQGWNKYIIGNTRDACGDATAYKLSNGSGGIEFCCRSESVTCGTWLEASGAGDYGGICDNVPNVCPADSAETSDCARCCVVSSCNTWAVSQGWSYYTSEWNGFSPSNGQCECDNGNTGYTTSDLDGRCCCGGCEGE